MDVFCRKLISVPIAVRAFVWCCFWYIVLVAVLFYVRIFVFISILANSPNDIFLMPSTRKPLINCGAKQQQLLLLSTSSGQILLTQSDIYLRQTITTSLLPLSIGWIHSTFWLVFHTNSCEPKTDGVFLYITWYLQKQIYLCMTKEKST